MSRINAPYSLTKQELDEEIGRKVGELAERLQKKSELLADLGDVLVEKDRTIDHLVIALRGMLDGYRRGQFNILDIENAHNAIAKAAK